MLKIQFSVARAFVVALSFGALLSLRVGAEETRYYIHVAQQGDTLIKIASRYLIKRQNWQPLKTNNKIDNPNLIPVGTRIRIPVEWMRTEQVNGEVIAIKGKVESSNGAVAIGSKVNEGDKLQTGDDGFVSILLADGSVLKVQSRTAIRIENARQLANTGGVADTIVKLDKGRVETVVAKQKGPGARYEIRTPTSNMGVRGTVFRVGGDEAGQRALSEVVEGLVGVTSAGQAKVLALPAGFGTIVDAGKPPSAPIALLPAPDLSGFSAAASKADARIQFPALAAAQRYRGQVASDAAFTNLLADASSTTPSIDFAGLPDGKLFVRVRGVDPNGLEGTDAVKPFVVKATPVPPFLSYPATNGQVAAGQTRFEWASTKEAVAYQIQIDRDTKFATPVVDKRVLAGSAFSPETALAPGGYQWRVASVRGNGDAGPFSDPQSFTVRDVSTKLDIPKVKGGEARFSWGGQPGQSYQFQLSRTERFTEIVVDRVVDKAEIVLDGLTKNVYYIRVRAVDKLADKASESANSQAAGFKGPWSETQQVEIYTPQWWLLMFGLPVVSL